MKAKVKKVESAAGEKRLKVTEDLIWGVHPVFEALEQEPQRIAEILVVKDRRGGKIDTIVELARTHGIRLNFVPGLKLTGEGGSQARHQGVIARMAATGFLPFAELLEKLKARVATGENVRIVACDSLQDPHNLGAIIRSALASGAAAVIVTRERSAPLGGTAAKASAGAIAHLDISQVSNLSQSLQALKDIGFWVFGAVKEASAVSLYESNLCLPACLVVGSEGKGIRPLVRKQCDILLSIPMAGELDSLNSSVAAAVILFEGMRQNLNAGKQAQLPS